MIAAIMERHGALTSESRTAEGDCVAVHPKSERSIVMDQQVQESLNKHQAIIKPTFESSPQFS